MKQKKPLLVSLLAVALASTLVGCNEGASNSKWDFSKETLGEAGQLYAEIDRATSPSAATFRCNPGLSIFSRQLSKDDILFFDTKRVSDALEESDLDSLTYGFLQGYLQDIQGLTFGDSNDDFTITFDGTAVEHPCAIISSEATYSGNYVFVTEYTLSSDGNVKDPQKEIEERYCDEPFDWKTGVKTGVQVIGHIGSIIAGASSGNAVGVVNGVFGILNTFGATFLSSGTTLGDVMNLLNQMDEKLDTIIQKMDQNHQQLMDETIRTQTMVDQTLLNAAKSNVTSFITDYQVPVDDITRVLADAVKQGFKAFSKSSQTIEVYLQKNDAGAWDLASLTDSDLTGKTEVTVSIDSFPNTADFLAKHSDVPESGFLDAFQKDIQVAIDAIAGVYPSEVSAESMRDFAVAHIGEMMMKDYYVSHTDNALTYMNKMINYAKRVSGRLSESIINDFDRRFTYLYNFAGEMKEPLVTYTAQTLYYLDTNVAKAISACVYAGKDSEELVTEYKKAREALQENLKSYRSLKDGYSFILSKNIAGDLFHGEYNNWFTNKGNHPTYHHQFVFSKCWGQSTLWSKTVDMNTYSWISAADHTRLSMRWNLLKGNGLCEASQEYAAYLSSCGALSKEAVETENYLRKTSAHAAVDTNRIFTGLSTRTLTKADNVTLITEDKANGKSSYFTVNATLSFRGKHDNSHWNGTIAESDFIDGATGGHSSSKFVAAYATYTEGHWYWRNDEDWLFADQYHGRYFLGTYVDTAA